MARAAHRQRARVVLVAHDPQRLRAAADQIGTQNQPVTAIPADVTKQDEVDALFSRILAELGRLDTLVNCVGKSVRGEVLETTAEDFQQLWELNFLSVVRCARAALPQLIASRGHLVNVGSLAAKSASRYLGAYPASKFPLVAYSQQLRLELGPRGVHVLLVCPGPIARSDAGQRYEHAQNIPESARQPGGGVKLRGIDPEWLARRTLRACQRRKPELVVPAKAKLLFAISQLWPGLGDRIVKRMT